VGDLVLLAGGLTPDAESTAAMLTRVDERQERIVLRADLATPSGREVGLRNGDALRVPRLRPTLDSGVVLQGHVYTPGTIAFRQGMRLTDVIHSVDELRPNADLHYVLIRREAPPDRRIEAFSADVEQALEMPGGSADIALTPRDRIIVFDLESGRDRVIQPLLTELQLQSNFGRPAEVVRVDGRVKVPGEYPLEPRMKVSDLIRAGGSLSEAAYGGQAELARYTVVNGSERLSDLIKIDLAAALKGDPKADLELKPFDSLSIKELSLWGDQEQVTLRGQVRFPGVYTVKQGETLKSVLQRAGGLTEYAFAQGSVFVRVDLKTREQQQLDLLAQRTQSDITAMALQGAAAGTINGNGGGGSGTTALAVGQSLLTQLKSVTAVGRLVIDLPRLMAEPAGSQDDVVLRNGDQLLVPRFQQEVTVIGEVQSTTSHLYRSSLTRDDYIQLSGGMTRRADTSKIYIVRADGSVVAGESAHFFRSGSQGPDIRAGDTIVVPMNTEKLPAITEWQAITSILYNLAVATAAVHAVGVF
jgi:protein involved in polysaccharide export with SLBB domain